MKQLICLLVIVLLASFCSTALVTIAATDALAVTAAATGAVTLEVVNGFALVASATAAVSASAPTAAFYGGLLIACLSPALVLSGAVAAGQEVLLENHPLYLRHMENFEAFDDDH